MMMMKKMDLDKKKKDAHETEHEREEIHSLVDPAEPSIKIQDKGPPWWRSQRFILAYILFAGMMNVFFQRVNFSIAIICMVNHTAVSSHNRLTPCRSNDSSNSIFHDRNFTNHIPNIHQVVNSSKHFEISNAIRLIYNSESTTKDSHNVTFLENNLQSHDDLLHSKMSHGSDDWLELTTEIVRNMSSGELSLHGTDGCGQNGVTSEAEKEDGPLLWDKETQGLLLGAIYWTYIFVTLPGNLIVRKVKKKTVVVYSMFVMSAMTLLMHVAALWSEWALFAVRLVQGACTALVIIAMYGMWEKWAPPSERASLISLAMSGQMLGNIIVFPLSALLCKYGFLGGWPSIFYVCGGLGFLWTVLFFFLTDESPTTHKLISEQEKLYLISALSHNSYNKKPKTPWLAILTSPPFWGIVCGQFSFTWGLLLILSTLPQYMLEVLNFDIKSNGVFTMLPYIALLFTTQIAGATSDCLIKRKILTVLSTRKLCILIANLVPAILLTALSFLDHTQAELAIVLLVFGVAATGFGLAGFLVSPYDIAPRFATEMMTISNTFATMPGILTTYVVAAITKDQTREQWQIVYFLTAGVYVLGAVGFCLLHQGVVQPWAMDQGQEMAVVKGTDVNRNDGDGRKFDVEKNFVSDDC